MTTVDIDHLLRNDELLQLLDAAEQAGSLKATELADVVETHELDALEQDALYRELDRRGIEVIADEPKEEEPPPAPAPVVAAGDDDRRAAALPARGGPPCAPDRGRRRSSWRRRSRRATCAPSS